MLRKFNNNNKNDKIKNCKCRIQTSCPVGGNGEEKSVVYRAEVEDEKTSQKEGYIGLAGDTFKVRYANHMKSFRNKKYEHETCLSKYIWNKKENEENFNIKWKFIDRGTLFNPVTMRCNLCLKEKYHLIFRTDSFKINTRNEFGATCRHIRPHIIENFKPQGIT